ncbi:MAG: hypothetical protein LBJ67_17990 [Planctomycetaceae bacterium]|jgi:acetyltransferase-like isoleucine patch superfamily enzyme|nr:hypothetical protein [Planctomycetaceae bacterium]
MINKKIFASFVHWSSIILNSFRITRLKLSGVKIGKRTFVSKCAKIDIRRGNIVIGNDCYITHGSVILCHDAAARLMKKQFVSTTIIGNDVFIGVNAVILPGLIVGDHAIIAAGAVVTKNIENGAIVAGNPAKVIGQRHADTFVG